MTKFSGKKVNILKGPPSSYNTITKLTDQTDQFVLNVECMVVFKFTELNLLCTWALAKNGDFILFYFYFSSVNENQKF